jgi:hypothetical protein
MADLHHAFYTRRRKAALAEKLESMEGRAERDESEADGPEWP